MQAFARRRLLIESFIVTVIGGMGSIVGAFVAALIIGLTRAFGSVGFRRHFP